MAVSRYIERIRRIDDLIKRKATGTPEEFAEKMQIDRSTLMRTLSELRKMDGPICYDPIKQSYYYEEDVKFEIGFKKISNSILSKTIGGKIFFKEISSVSKYATDVPQLSSMFNF